MTNPSTADLHYLGRVQVRYVTLPGWKTSIAAARHWDQLPTACQAYVEYIEKFLGVPVRWIGVGPGRADMVTR